MEYREEIISRALALIVEHVDEDGRMDPAALAQFCDLLRGQVE
jgi:hypothetical protein